MLNSMIAITTPELERRIHRFEVGAAKLEQLSKTPVGRQPGEQEALESNLKAFLKELADMRSLHAQRLAGGPGASADAAR
jgi:hypothetical protein